ncbi:alpha/beta hydrolase [Paenarthrobacter nicotinovorans]|uniref:alpha/beta hydrolase n=1 Tax=Paenarthrobacter nicotinovorans TaxID=29320 RepID=UPI003813E7E7
MEYIAPDSVLAVRVFREGGAISHHQMTLEQARVSYDKVCQVNAVLVPGDVATDDIAGGKPAVNLRRYRPAGTPPGGPAVVFVHGGGWVMGSVDTHDAICRYLSLAAGATVFSVDYRLAPEHPYPAAADDCAAAVDFVLDPSSGLDIDPARVVLAGDSAGGQLVASLVNRRLRAGTLPFLAGVVLVYPVTDLTMKGRSHREVTGFPLVHDTMSWFINQYVPANMDRGAADLSPGLHPVPAGHPPTYIATVHNDPLRSEGRDYARALKAAGALRRHDHFDGHHHGLLTNAGAIPTGRVLLDSIASFIRDVPATSNTESDIR